MARQMRTSQLLQMGAPRHTSNVTSYNRLLLCGERAAAVGRRMTRGKKWCSEGFTRLRIFSSPRRGATSYAVIMCAWWVVVW